MFNLNLVYINSPLFHFHRNNLMTKSTKNTVADKFPHAKLTTSCTSSIEKPRVTLPGFVSTSVMTSTENYHVSEERIVEKVEDKGLFRPLYDQLQEMKEKKDAEWKSLHNPFGKAKGFF